MAQSGGKFVTLNPDIEDRCIKYVYRSILMRFLGNIEAKTDAKGRAFLPAQFRKVLAASGEESLVLRQDVFENLLVLYPMSVWNGLMDEMRRKLSRWDRRQQMAYRTFVSSVVELSIDGSGRILIPRSFLEATGINQSIRFVGMGDTIEIWPADTMETMSKEDFSLVLDEAMKEEKNMKEDKMKENKKEEQDD